MKIFINCATGLGNIILFLPAYHALKNKYPNADYVIGLDARFYDDNFFKLQFGEKCKFVKITSKTNGHIRYLLSFCKLTAYSFDVTISAYNGSSVFSCICLLRVGAKRTIFFQTKSKLLNKLIQPVQHDLLNATHYININFLTVAALGVPPTISPKWLLLDDSIARDISKKLIWIGIHPGGNTNFNTARQWPKEYYKELLRIISKEFNVKFIFFGKGEKESKLIDFITTDCISNTLKIVNQSLNEVTNILSQCDLFVGNDSSLMHMSVALDITTFCIIGPTNPMRTGPYGYKHKYIGLNLECMPCFDKGLSEKCSHHSCIKKLYPEIVSQKIIAYLRNNK